MRIAHNITAMNGYRQLKIVQGTLAGSAEKLASGYKVNRSADDAAGLSISEKMRKQIRGLSKAVENAEDGISMVQIADGALDEVQQMLQRMNELCVQAANGTNASKDRQYIQDEVNQLKAEIDKISSTTKFNEIYLLDGSLADPFSQAAYDVAYKKAIENAKADVFVTGLNGQNNGKRMTLAEMEQLEGTKLFYYEITDEVETTQTAAGDATQSGYDNLKKLLMEELVPQAVQSLLNTYDDTFGYLNGSSIGIGLKLETAAGSGTLASVTLATSYSSNGSDLQVAGLGYRLTVNMAYLGSDPNNMSDAIREELEVTIVHEMMHAMMDEALTSGMIGYAGGGSLDASEKFPKWFREGMAQTAAGAFFNGNDWINGGFGLTTSSSISDIQNVLKGSDKLANDEASSSASYGTGYLACMYLGYLANGGSSVSASSVAEGLDKIMSEIKGGKSLDTVISELTSYSGIDDFESKFGDTASAQFVKELIAAVGTNGAGGLVTGDYTDSDLLPDSTLNMNLFKLDTTNDMIMNQYPSDYEVLAGGAAYGTGGESGPTGTGTGTGGTGTGGTGTGGTGGTGTGGTGTGGTGTGGTGAGGTGVGGIAASTKVTGTGCVLQVGADSSVTNKITIYIDGMDSKSIGVSEVDVTTQDTATLSIKRVDLAINRVSEQRSALGAYQNRLEHTIKNLNNVIENTTAAESAIRDTDMAKEMVKLTNQNILQQSGLAMLAQSKQSTYGVIALLY